MKITSAEFIKGIIGTDKILYDGKKQIAFVGRSNVGKSSVINALTNRKELARSSSRPGKTIRLDFFLINNQLYFVDLPGYGFAKMSGKQQEDIRKMMLWYLQFSGVKNRKVVLIVDSLVGLTEFDKEMVGLLVDQGLEFAVVANKIDKVPFKEVAKKLQDIEDHVDSIVIPCSTTEKIGIEKILKWID